MSQEIQETQETKEMFKLRLRITIYRSRTKVETIYREFVWENEEDAKACQALLNKAPRPFGMDVEFLRFVPEQPL